MLEVLQAIAHVVASNPIEFAGSELLAIPIGLLGLTVLSIKVLLS